MFPRQHIFLGLIFTIFLLIIFPSVSLINLSLVFLSSFLIDVDHYLFYAFKKRDLSLKNSYSWYLQHHKKFTSLSKAQRKQFFPAFCFFHGLEFLICLLLLTLFFNNHIFFILIGCTFHLSLDWYNGLLIDKRNTERISLIYDFLKFKRANRVQSLQDL